MQEVEVLALDGGEQNDAQQTRVSKAQKRRVSYNFYYPSRVHIGLT